jgi:hypothetical protein
MTAERDITRIVRSWIRTDEHESADRVLHAVLSRLDTTPQRRSWWPARREHRMNTLTKAAIGIAAVLVLAFVGLRFLPTSSVGPPGPSPTPIVTPNPTQVVTAAPTTRPPDIPRSGSLQPGRHSLTLEGVPFTLEIATTGWTSNGAFGFDKGQARTPTGRSFIFWVEDPDLVFADPCNQEPGAAVGPTAADMAGAIAAMPQLELVSGPTAVTIGGQPAQHVVVRVPDEIPCQAADFYLWGDGTGGNDRFATEAGFTVWVWIIDVDGKRVQIDGETYAGAGPEAGDELRTIVESIEFE